MNTFFLKASLVMLIVLSFFDSINVFSQYIGQSKAGQNIQPKIKAKAYGFDLQDVKLLPGRFKENMERDGKWLLSIENNRLLHSWKVNAGMPTNARPLGGWEGLDVE